MPDTSLKDAIRLAKDFVREAFTEEHPDNIGLEEIRFDDDAGAWLITIGFSRPWADQTTMLSALQDKYGRVYKVVTIDDRSGKAKSIVQREIAA